MGDSNEKGEQRIPNNDDNKKKKKRKRPIPPSFVRIFRSPATFPLRFDLSNHVARKDCIQVCRETYERRITGPFMPDRQDGDTTPCLGPMHVMYSKRLEQHCAYIQ